MNKFEALNLIALRGALKPDSESNVRYVMRWYSKTFHTPLHDVPDLPLEDVWLAFYEERYHGMKIEDLLECVSLAIETPEETAERLRAEDAEAASEAVFADMTEKMAKLPKVKPVVNPHPEELLNQVPALAETQQSVLSSIEALEPDIKMEFVDPEEMERLLEGSMGGSK